ncbi:MAG: ABC transporter permease [Bryobacteraceae bacterium]|nr:ABC transporter permease [Bryobacteraceae bacterium]
MRYLREVMRLLFRKSRIEASLEEELRSAQDLLAERYAANGLPPEQATRRARMDLEGPEQTKERVRDVRPGALLESFLQDVRLAFRSMRREPAFAGVAILTLALGMGVNTAAFGVLHSVVLDPLPYREPDRISLIWCSFRQMGAPRAPGSGPMLKEVERQTTAFSSVAGIWVGNATIQGDPEPEQVKQALVTWNFFDALGAAPSIGRAFAAADENAGPPKTAVISDGLWRRRFGGDPAILGKPLRLGRNTLTIIGVMPPAFRLHFPPDANVPAEPQIFVPFSKGLESAPKDLYYIRLLGRIKTGQSLAQAQSDLDAVAARLREGHTEYAAENLTFTAAPLQGDSVREVRPALLALMAGAAFVLLIASVNVANLLLSRGAARRREMAVRLSIGASRGRIVRQLLAESLALASVAAIGALALGWAAVKLVQAMRPDTLARLDGARLDPAILAFTAAVAILTAVLFGVSPAAEAARIDLASSLKDGARSTGGTRRRRLREGLVIAEVTLCYVLLTCATLAILTFFHLQKSSPGFDPQGVLTFEIQPGSGPPEGKVNFVRELERRLAALPGVTAAGAVSHLPLDDYPNWYSPYVPDGIAPEKARGLLADQRAVTPGYFRAMGATLKAGRLFDDNDRAATAGVVIVDDVLAASTWPGESAIGKRLQVERYHGAGFETAKVTVAGVVEHLRHHSLTRQLRGQIYIPYPQSPREHLSFALRTPGDPLALAAPARSVLHSLNKDMAIAKVRTMTSYVSRAQGPVNLNAVVAAIVGVLGLLLAAIGVYSVIAYSVVQREKELGVRMALGAEPRDVLRLVLRKGLALAGLGIALGVAGALVLARLLESILFGVTPFHWPTYLWAAAVIAAAALAACWLPAARASRGSVLTALRLE